MGFIQINGQYYMACQATDGEVLLCSFPSMTEVEDGIAIPKANYVGGRAEFDYSPLMIAPGPDTPTAPEGYKPFVFNSLSSSIPGRYNYVNCEFEYTTWEVVSGGAYFEFNIDANNVALVENLTQSENSPLRVQTDYGTASNVVAASVCYVVDNMTGGGCLACKMVDGRYALVAINDGTSTKVPQSTGYGSGTRTFDFTPSPLPTGDTPEPPAGFLSNFKFTNGIVPAEAPQMNVLNGSVQVVNWSYEEGVAQYEIAIMVDGVDIMGVPTVLAAGDYAVEITRAT